MTRWCGLVTLGVGLAIGGGPRAAIAALEVAVDPSEERTRVLVLPLQLQGELPPDTATEMLTVVADNLADDGLEIIRDGASECADAACRRELAEGANASFVVGAEVVGDEEEFSVTLTLYSGETGEALAPFADGCSICGFVEVRDMVRLRSLDVREEIVGRQRAARVELPAPKSTPIDRPASRSKLVPAGWSLVGAGSAATVGGAVLLALHKRSAGCLDNPRGGDCVPLRYTTAPAGAALLGTGVVVVVSGVVMVVLGRRAERREQEPRVSVRGLGLRLRF